MELLRMLLSTLAFTAGIACLVYGLTGDSLLPWLVGMALCFLLAYWLWPRGRDAQSPWLDVLELLVELPVNAVLWLLRQFGRLFRDVDGVDL